jgi:chaperonin GroEL
MATVVGATLGPGGRPVLIERDGLSPLITKDGVTVAKSLGLGDATQNVLIEAAKEICINTAQEAGDGTTTAIILADAITQCGQEFIKANPKYNRQRLASELEGLYNDVIVKYLKKNAIKADTEEKLLHVASISANGDNKIASAVVEAVMTAGDDGQVLIEEAQGKVLRVENVDGYVVTTGLKELGSIGPAFINDKSGQQAKLANGVVFLYDGSINDLSVPAKIQDEYETSSVHGSPIIIFAHDFSDMVLDRFAKQTTGGLSVIPIKTPMSGLPNSRSMFLQDMSAYTGATVINPGNIENLNIDQFGDFSSAKVNMYETFILNDYDSEDIEERIKQLKAVSEAAMSEFDKMHIRAAISKLTGGISTIWVGGASELEIREKKARVEDAVEAVRSAIAEGVVPGGCSVQLALSNILEKHEDYQPSWSIMVNALRKPFNILMNNSGNDPQDILNQYYFQPHEDVDTLPNKVLDARNHKMVPPFEAGIIEPAKVCRVAIGNALSVASLLITLGGLIVVPRNADLENQLEGQKEAFKDMLSSGGMGAN